MKYVALTPRSTSELSLGMAVRWEMFLQGLNQKWAVRINMLFTKSRVNVV